MYEASQPKVFANTMTTGERQFSATPESSARSARTIRRSVQL